MERDLEKFMLILLNKHLDKMVLKPQIPFYKLAKYARIHILIVASILHIMSQVEHTKKHNIIDYKSKSVKQNHANYQNHLTVCFNTLLWYCHALRKRFWLEQDALA